MKYFMYSPLDMTVEEAYRRASHDLHPNHYVNVTTKGNVIIPAKPGQRPQALPETYLVRVEQDGSLRVVQKALS